MSCIKELKGEIFVEIDTQTEACNQLKETRTWKAVLAVDALIFHDVKGEPGCSRAQQIADRVKQCHRGQWAALWSNVSIATPFEQDEDKGTEHSRCARKDASLLEANEGSKAATAVWGTGVSVPKEEVKEALNEIQKDFLQQNALK